VIPQGDANWAAQSRGEVYGEEGGTSPVQAAFWAASAHPKEDEALRRVFPQPRRDSLVGVTSCLPPLLPPHPHLAPASSEDVQTSGPQPAASSISAGTAPTDGVGELIHLILPQI